jgi:probable HAF family extracellular repeat protein
LYEEKFKCKEPIPSDLPQLAQPSRAVPYQNSNQTEGKATMSIRKHLCMLLTAPLLAAPLSALADPSYSVTFLPTGFSARNLGNNGEVIGSSATAAGSIASIWMNGTMSTYGTLGGTGSFFSGISSAGVLTGASDTAGNIATRAFVYENGVMRDVGATARGTTLGVAINSSGQVAGWGEIGPAGESRAFVYSDGVLKQLGTLGGSTSTASDINDSGVVVGFARDANGQGGVGAVHPYAYSNGVMTDLGLMGGDEGGATAINNAGDIVGTIQTGNGLGKNAFLYSGGVMHDIGSLGGVYSIASDINALGQIVGRTTVTQDPIPNFFRAYLYEDGKMQDLNSMVSGIDGWNLDGAFAINDSGQILAFACPSGAPCRSVLLNPISAVPEPATWVMLLAGLGALRVRRLHAGRGGRGASA